MDNVDQQKMESAQKENNTTGLLVVLVVLVLLGAGLFYVISSGVFKGEQGSQVVQSPVAQNVQKMPSNQDDSTFDSKTGVYKPNFSYQVKSIDGSVIVITGKNGDVTWPNDPEIVKVYAGSTKNTATVPLSQLKVGDHLNIEVIPGKSADFFLVQM